MSKMTILDRKSRLVYLHVLSFIKEKVCVFFYYPIHDLFEHKKKTNGESIM